MYYLLCIYVQQIACHLLECTCPVLDCLWPCRLRREDNGRLIPDKWHAICNTYYYYYYIYIVQQIACHLLECTCPVLVQVPVTVHTGPSERSSPSEPHAQTARPPLFMFPLLCSRSSSGVVIGPRLPIERELDPQPVRLRLGREGRSLARSLHR